MWAAIFADRTFLQGLIERRYQGMISKRVDYGSHSQDCPVGISKLDIRVERRRCSVPTAIRLTSLKITPGLGRGISAVL